MIHVALLAFPNVIRPGGSNYDREMSHFTGAVTLKIMHPSFTAPSFTVLAISKKYFLGRKASHDAVVSQVGHYENLLQTPTHFFGAWLQFLYELLSVCGLSSLTCPSILFCRSYIM